MQEGWSVQSYLAGIMKFGVPIVSEDSTSSDGNLSLLAFSFALPIRARCWTESRPPFTCILRCDSLRACPICLTKY